MAQLIRITPNKARAASILRMVEPTLEMISTLDANRFPSHIVREYYEALRELISIRLLLDGYIVKGEGAHKHMIHYLGEKNLLPLEDRKLIDELREIRNHISYDGFFVEAAYLQRKRLPILDVVTKLKKLISV